MSLGTSMRGQWTFGFEGGKIAEAARRKAQHHRTREQWWTDERNMAEERITASREVTQVPVSGGVRHEVRVDAQAEQRYNECKGKATLHAQKADEFEQWAEVMGLNPTVLMTCTADDVAYFGLTAVLNEEDRVDLAAGGSGAVVKTYFNRETMDEIVAAAGLVGMDITDFIGWAAARQAEKAIAAQQRTGKEVDGGS